MAAQSEDAKSEHDLKIDRIGIPTKKNIIMAAGATAVASLAVFSAVGHFAAANVPVPPPQAVVRPFDSKVITGVGDPMISIKANSDSSDVIDRCKASKFITIFL